MNETERNPESEIVRNDYGQSVDPAVVVEEKNRTVLLTPGETLVIEKEPAVDIVPKNRPRHVYAGMWGRNEIVSVTLGIFALLVVVLIYVFLVIPSNRQLASHKSEADNLEIVRSTAYQNWGSVKDARTRAVELISSEESFEQRYLLAADTGRNELYQRLNGLIDEYGLTNTSGPDYSPLDAVDTSKANEQQSEGERGRDKYRSLFPGVYVSMTVEGSYQNLRRFIKEIETGQEFVVISAVQLVPSDSQSTAGENKPAQLTVQPQSVGPTVGRAQPINPATGRPIGPTVAVQQPQPVPPQQKGKTKGEVVSLHLEMAAYFRRPNFSMTLEQ